MKKIILALALILCASGTKAQIRGAVQTTTGQAVAGAIVTVCSYSSGSYNSSGQYTGSFPCSPASTIYYDPALTQAITTLLSDGQGNYFFYAAAGNYTVTITAPGRIQSYGFSATINSSGSGCIPGGSAGALQKNNSGACAAAALVDNGTTITASEPVVVPSLNNTVYADQQTGADPGAKIAAAIALLPSTGGTVDATAFQGAQSFTGLTVTKNNVHLKVAAATFTYSTAAFTINANNFELDCSGTDFVAANASNVNWINVATDGAAHTGFYVHGCQNDGNAANQTLATYAIRANTAGGSISNFRIIGNYLHDGKRASNAGNEIQINVSGSTQGIISNNLCLNHACVGLFGTDMTVSNNIAINSDDDAFAAVGGSSLPVSRITFSGNTVDGTTAGAGFDVVNGRNITVTGNTIQGASGNGILLWDNSLGAGNFTTDSSVVGNTISGTLVGQGINIQGQRISVSGNTSKANAQAGIYVGNASSYVTVTGNTTMDNGAVGGDTYGIMVDGGGAAVSNILISGNTSGDDGTATQTYGALIGGASESKTYLIGNVFQGNVTGGYSFVSGSANVANGNSVNNVMQIDDRVQTAPTLNSTTDFLRALALPQNASPTNPASGNDLLNFDTSDIFGPLTSTGAFAGAKFGGMTLTGTGDFSGMTLGKWRLSAGLTTSTNGDFGEDTTNSNWHFWNGADSIMAPLASGFVSGDCGQPTSTAGKWVIADAGAACGTGGGGANTALSNLAAVSINTSFLAQTGVDLGGTANPFRNLYLFGAGTYGTTYLKLTGTPTSTRTVTFPDATDTVVELTQTQTLTNKTMSGASNTFSNIPYSVLTGTPQLAQTKSPVSHQWLASYDASTGLFTQSQPAYSDISGTPTLAQTKSPVSHQWLASYDASTGLFTQSQPACSDVSGCVAPSVSFRQYTASQTLTGSDAGVVDMKCASACTVTLPASIPANYTVYSIEWDDSGAGAVTINPNGKNMTICTNAASTSNFTMPTAGGSVFISTDGTSWFASCPLQASTNVTIAAATTGLQISASSTGSTAFSALTASTNSNAGTFAASGNTWDFSAASAFKVPVAALFAPTASGSVGYDSTNNKWVFGQNGATVSFGLSSSACSTHQWVNTPATSMATASCSQPAFSDISGTLALNSAVFANQGTTTTVLHGNAAGNPSFGAVTPSDASGNTSGSGNFCLTTNCAMTTPNLGTPSAINLSNATSLPCAAMPALTGNVTTSAGACSTTIASGAVSTADLANNAVTSAKMAVANTYRVCDIAIGDTSASALTNAQLGPQSRVCFVPAASTIVEMDVNADAGTPNIIIGRNHAGTIVNIVSAALATAASGGIACSNTGGTTGINGATTCSATLQNTSLSAGDYLEAVSGTAGGTAKFFVAHIIYTVN